MKIKTLIKIGIADAHGIESYLDLKDNEKKFGFLSMRASLNRQRHAVAYKAEVKEIDDKEILKLLKLRKWEDALRYLKANNIKIELSFNGAGNVKKSWELIPNSDLDPFR